MEYFSIFLKCIIIYCFVGESIFKSSCICKIVLSDVAQKFLHASVAKCSPAYSKYYIVKKCANSFVSISHSEPENVKKSSPKNSWNEMIILIKEIFLTIFDISLNSVQFSGPLCVFMSHLETNVNHCAKFLFWITHPNR